MRTLPAATRDLATVANCLEGWLAGNEDPESEIRVAGRGETECGQMVERTMLFVQ